MAGAGRAVTRRVARRTTEAKTGRGSGAPVEDEAAVVVSPQVCCGCDCAGGAVSPPAVAADASSAGAAVRSSSDPRRAIAASPLCRANTDGASALLARCRHGDAIAEREAAAGGGEARGAAAGEAAATCAKALRRSGAAAPAAPDESTIMAVDTEEVGEKSPSASASESSLLPLPAEADAAAAPPAVADTSSTPSISSLRKAREKGCWSRPRTGDAAGVKGDGERTEGWGGAAKGDDSLAPAAADATGATTTAGAGGTSTESRMPLEAADAAEGRRR
jgi:hypothetical protein